MPGFSVINMTSSLLFSRLVSLDRAIDRKVEIRPLNLWVICIIYTNIFCDTDRKNELSRFFIYYYLFSEAKLDATKILFSQYIRLEIACRVSFLSIFLNRSLANNKIIQKIMGKSNRCQFIKWFYIISAKLRPLDRRLSWMAFTAERKCNQSV
jgi:hypothetical protein